MYDGGVTPAVFKIIRKLADESVAYGTYDTYRMRVCHHIITTHGFAEQLKTALETESQARSIPDFWSLCGLLLSLAACHSDADSGCHDKITALPSMKALAELLIPNDRCNMSETLASRFDISLSGAFAGVSSDRENLLRHAPSSLQAVRAQMKPPGTRDYDNDKVNFREIAIVPSAEELETKEIAYLPPPGPHGYGADGHLSNQVNAHLDRLFRLMREDMVEPMRKELQEEVKLPPEKRKKLVTEPRLVAVDDGRGLELTVAFRPPLNLSHRLDKMKPRERLEFLEDGPGRRVLAMDTIVVFLNFAGNPPVPKVVAVGVISSRQDILGKKLGQKLQNLAEKDPKNHKAPPPPPHHEPISLYANIAFPQRIDLPYVFNSALEGLPHASRGKQVAGFAFCASASYFSYEPVLSGLQQLPTIPLAYHLLPGCPDANEDTSDEGPSLRRLPAHMDMDPGCIDADVRKKVALDPGQDEALNLLTKEKVVLVQGPPGTGKTYVGVQMVQAMLKAAKRHGRPRLKILCMCYTNHAIDSFLESLLEDGVARESVVRLGSGPRVSEQLQDRTLRELPDAKFSREQSKRYAMLKRQLEENAEESRNMYLQLWYAQWGNNPGVQQWDDIETFLDEYYSAELDQLTVAPDMLGEGSDGFTTVGKRGKALEPQAAWVAWCNGKPPPPYTLPSVRRAFEKKDGSSLWILNKGERLKLKTQWNTEATQERVRGYIRTLLVRQDLNRNLQSLRDESRSAALHDDNIKVVGCTTVGAAKRMAILAALQPDVLLLEEAGEVFEAQVLVAARHCHQIIMIGDHEQLRPKAEHYDLRKEGGQGHDIDVSLFERLVLQKARPLSMATLQIQHRMRPTISKFPRKLKYPDLRDAEKTKGRPWVPGVALKRAKKPPLPANVVFIDHEHMEKSDEEAAALGSNSKINDHEADMVVAIAKYLLEQTDVHSSDIGERHCRCCACCAIVRNPLEFLSFCRVIVHR